MAFKLKGNTNNFQLNEFTKLLQDVLYLANSKQAYENNNIVRFHSEVIIEFTI